jgi:hypothetical protein
MDLAIQSAASLIAILALAGLAWWLKLGGSVRLRSDADVARAASEAEDGFAPLRSSIGRNGEAALARDAAGRIILIKRHGNKFVGRVLTSAASAREEVDALVVDCAEARFGPVRLSLKDAAYWADAINRL